MPGIRYSSERGKDMNEKRLIARIRHGNASALNELIRIYYPSVKQYVSLKLPVKEDAQDITQEVFLRFIRQIPTYRHEGKLANYLYVIASHCCTDHFRTQKHQPLPLEETKIRDPGNLHIDTLRKLEHERLHALIVRLPPEEQDAVVFHDLKEMSFREISEMLDVPQSTLKSRHAWALSRLRSLWKE